MKRTRNTARPASASVFAAVRSHLDIENLELRSMLAADTIDALVASPADETPACFWTPGDAQVAVCPVDTTVTDPVAVPSIATDPMPLIDSVFDPSTVLPIFVLDPTGDSDGTGLLTDGTSRGTDDPSFDSGVSDGSADGSDPDAIDVLVQFVSSDVGWAAYSYSVAGDGAVTGVSVFASYDEPTLAVFVAEHADDASVQMFDCGDGWWIIGFPPELAPPVPVGDQTFVDPTTETDSLTGDAPDGSDDGIAAGATDPDNGLATDPTVDTTQGEDAPSADTSSTDETPAGVIDAGSGEGLVIDDVIVVDPPVLEMRDWGRVLMAEDIVGLSVAQTSVESPAVDFSASPVVAFAGSDQPAAAISSEGRGAAFATLPDIEKANLASMYAAFAAGFSQSSADGQGSGVFAGTKRSARH